MDAIESKTIEVIEAAVADQHPAGHAIKHGGWYDVVSALLEHSVIPGAVHRILLYGPPGTGKTTTAFKLFGEQMDMPVEALTMHQQLPPDDMIGSMGLVERNGATVTQWADGPAIRAMRAGCPLVINEIDRRSPECESALYNVLDDMAICSVTLPTGETVKPTKGFCVFATMNPSPDCLPEAIQERFDIVLHCNSPAPGIVQNLPGDLGKMVENHYSQQRTKRWIPAVGARSITAAHRISGVIGRDAAFHLKFGINGTDVLASAATNA